MSVGRLLWRHQVSVSPAASVDGPEPIARRRGLLHRLAGLITVVGVPALTLSLAAGVADAAGAGKVTSYKGTRINGPQGIACGPDGALWFANYEYGTIGRITTTVTPQIGSFSPTSGPAEPR